MSVLRPMRVFVVATQITIILLLGRCVMRFLLWAVFGFYLTDFCLSLLKICKDRLGNALENRFHSL